MKSLSFFLIIFIPFTVLGQSQDRDETGNSQEDMQIDNQQIDREKEGHKFFLNSDKPVKEIKDISHSNDGTPIRSKLSPNGELVIMYNYQGRGGVTLQVVHEDGTESEMTKTPCDVFEDTILL